MFSSRFWREWKFLLFQAGITSAHHTERTAWFSRNVGWGWLVAVSRNCGGDFFKSLKVQGGKFGYMYRHISPFSLPVIILPVHQWPFAFGAVGTSVVSLLEAPLVQEYKEWEGHSGGGWDGLFGCSPWINTHGLFFCNVCYASKQHAYVTWVMSLLLLLLNPNSVVYFTSANQEVF